MTIILCNFLIDHFCLMSSSASQSSSFGWDGYWPCAPKSLDVFTMPVPKNCSQCLFTVTREVMGFLGDISHLANVRRL